MLENRQMPDVDDVLQVQRIGRRTGVGFWTSSGSSSAGEFQQRFAAVRVGAPRHVGRRQELRPGDQLDAQRRRLGHART